MDTIKSSDEISVLFKEGKRIGAPDLMLIVSRNEKQHGHQGRAAFIAGKKLGNAVWRNRAKRRMRAACAQAGGVPAGHDVLFIARKTTDRVSFGQLVEETNNAFAKAGLKHD